MNRNARIFAFAGCVLLAGCIPVLRTSTVAYGLRGTLSDADTGKPITRQHIDLEIEGVVAHAMTTTRQGEFRIPPVKEHYCAWAMGGPFRPGAQWTTLKINIMCNGYAPLYREWNRADAPPSGGYINLGEMKMMKRQPDGAADRTPRGG